MPWLLYLWVSSSSLHLSPWSYQPWALCLLKVGVHRSTLTFFLIISTPVSETNFWFFSLTSSSDGVVPGRHEFTVCALWHRTLLRLCFTHPNGSLYNHLPHPGVLSPADKGNEPMTNDRLQELSCTVFYYIFKVIPGRTFLAFQDCNNIKVL